MDTIKAPFNFIPVSEKVFFPSWANQISHDIPFADTESGMIIEFRALATLTNPSLFNVNTRESIEITKTMTAGEVIRINTYYAEEDVELISSGVTTNIFDIMKTGSKFLKLSRGDNLFRYDADSGLDNLVCSIYHRNLYLGV